MNKIMSLIFSVLVVISAIIAFVSKDYTDTKLIITLALLILAILCDVSDKINK